MNKIKDLLKHYQNAKPQKNDFWLYRADLFEYIDKIKPTTDLNKSIPYITYLHSKLLLIIAQNIKHTKPNYAYFINLLGQKWYDTHHYSAGPKFSGSNIIDTYDQIIAGKSVNLNL
jgi:hypothetical protein